MGQLFESVFVRYWWAGGGVVRHCQFRNAESAFSSMCRSPFTVVFLVRAAEIRFDGDASHGVIPDKVVSNPGLDHFCLLSRLLVAHCQNNQTPENHRRFRKCPHSLWATITQNLNV